MAQPSELPFFNFLPFQDREDMPPQVLEQLNDNLRQIDDSLRWLFENSGAGGSTIGAAYGNIQSDGATDIAALTLSEDLVIDGDSNLDVTLVTGPPNVVQLNSHGSLAYFLGE